FESKYFNLDIKNIKGIRLGIQVLKWQALLGGLSLMIFYWQLTGRNIIYMLKGTLIIGVFSLYFFWYLNKFIIVEYQDENNILKKAYFSDGGFRGYRGLFGGTKKM